MEKNVFIKAVGNIIVTTGVGYFVGNIAGATLPPNVKAAHKVLTLIGSTAVSSIIAGKANEKLDNYIDNMFDNIVGPVEGTVTVEN